MAEAARRADDRDLGIGRDLAAHPRTATRRYPAQTPRNRGIRRLSDGLCLASHDDRTDRARAWRSSTRTQPSSRGITSRESACVAGLEPCEFRQSDLPLLRTTGARGFPPMMTVRRGDIIVNVTWINATVLRPASQRVTRSTHCEYRSDATHDGRARDGAKVSTVETSLRVA